MKQINSSQRSEESNLKKYFDKIREENYDDTFNETGVWLNSINKIQTTKNSERGFVKMKDYFKSHKLKLAYSFLILAFLVAACNYPVTQEETIADVITWTVEKENSDAVNNIQNLSWVKNGNFNFNETDNNGESILEYSAVISGKDVNNVKDYQKQLESIPGILTVNVTSLNETVKRPVYSAALHEIFKIDINATNMSDKELEQEITNQLEKAGVEVTTVDFNKTEDGHRILKINLTEDGMKKDGGFDVTIKDGDKVERLKEVRKTGGDADRFKGMTDQEIKEMVKKDFKDANLSDEQIEIIRKDDKVMVQVKKTDGSVKGELEMEDVVK
jgi:hypothetical protein